MKALEKPIRQAAKPVLLRQIGGVEIRKWLGTPIDYPGIYDDMPISVYHSKDASIGKSVSSGNLRTIFTKSPAHYWCDSYYNDERPEEDQEESEALLFGRAVHTWIFGPKDEIHKEFYVVKDEWLDAKTGEIKPFNLARKECKEDVEKNAKGRPILRPKQREAINGMHKSIINHVKKAKVSEIGNVLSRGLLNGFIETSWFWRHEKTGIWIKIRPDCAPNDSLDFADLKTIHTLDWHNMQHALYEHGYFMQAGLTAMVVEALTGEKMHSFTFCFIEKKPPYDVAIVHLKDNEIDRGRLAAEKTIATFAECNKTGFWPGRYPDIYSIEMSEWQQKSIDARLETQ